MSKWFARFHQSLTLRMTALLLCSTVVVWSLFSLVLVWQVERMTHATLIQQHVQFANMLWGKFDDDDNDEIHEQYLQGKENRGQDHSTERGLDRDHGAADMPWDKHGGHGYSRAKRVHPFGDGSGMEFAIYDAKTGGLLNASSSPALPRQQDYSMTPHVETLNERVWLVSARQNEDIELVVASPDDSATKLAESIAKRMGLLALLGLLFLIPVLYWALRRGLKPIHSFTEDVASRAADNLAPITTPVPNELKPLQARLNDLFAQVERTIAREQRFTADAAHELRTPLAATRLQLELAAGSQRPEIRQKALHHATEAIDRATHVVSQLLLLARLEHGSEIEHQSIDFAHLAQQALSEADLPADDAHVQVDGTPALLGQPLLWALVLRNLIDNTQRYAGEGAQVFIHITAEVMRVYDTGKGIDDAQKSRLGERFYRPAGQTASGAGLGWSIIMRIAQLHHTEIETFDVQPHGFGVQFRFPKS